MVALKLEARIVEDKASNSRYQGRETKHLYVDAQVVSASRCLHLGRVDELFNDNPRGHEMNKRQKGLAQFLIPRGNASKLFEVIKEPFDLLA